MSFEFEAWWILIGIALFAAGWFAARVDIKLLVSESRSLPAWYFKGLNHLLNQQPDKAIESFVEVVKERPDTLELQFALGQLFRKQGEVDRATRIHQALLERPHLNTEHRQRALYALAQDFNAAGLLDRAEVCFKELDGTPHESAALAFLIRIYEMEKDWPQAIATTRKLEIISKRPFAKEVAQYYCELASTALVKRDIPAAQIQLDLALSENKRCVRASVLVGDAALAAGDSSSAIAAWERIETQHSDALGLVAERLGKAYASAGRVEEGIARLSHYQQAYPSQDVLSALLDLVRVHRGDSGAVELLRVELRRQPTLSGLEKLLSIPAAQISAVASAGSTGSIGGDADLMRSVIQHNTRSAGLYPCTRCGFRARTYYWQCPGCVQWESFSPRRQETSDVHT